MWVVLIARRLWAVVAGLGGAAREGASRIDPTAVIGAVIVTAALSGAGIGIVQTIRSGAVDRWRAALSDGNTALKTKSDASAAKARDDAERDLALATQRLAEVERALAAEKSDGIALSHEIVRRLNQ